MNNINKLVAIESPFRGNNYKETEINILYAKACIKDCLERKEYPYASHLFFTQNGILNDKIKKERQMGIDAGIAWAEIPKKRAIYIDRGISEGMEYGIKSAIKIGQIIEIRNLPNYESFLEKAKKISKNKYRFKK